jgi:hypothetical protein
MGFLAKKGSFRDETMVVRSSEKMEVLFNPFPGAWRNEIVKS